MAKIPKNLITILTYYYYITIYDYIKNKIKTALEFNNILNKTLFYIFSISIYINL